MAATSGIIIFGSNRYGNLGIDHLIVQDVKVSISTRNDHVFHFHALVKSYNKKQQVMSVPTRLVPHMILPDGDTSGWDQNMHLIDQVECGMYHSVFLASNVGRVYLCGDNTNCQCSYRNNESGWRERTLAKSERPEDKVARAFGTPVPLREQDTIGHVKLIAAGASHTLLYTSKNMIYGFGCNSRGQIPTSSGILQNVLCQTAPIRYPDGEWCVAIVCGSHHSWFISNNGNFYCCGSDMDYQCLGMATGGHYPVPLTKFSHDQVPKSFKISKIACCYYSTILLGEDGSLYGFGQNNYGQLALGYTSDKQPCTKIPSPSGETSDPVVDIFCKYNSSAFVTRSGRVYMSGDSWSGQCGVKKDFITTPVLIQIDEPVVQVACALNSTLFRTVNRNVYACGDNTNGIIGIPQQQSNSPLERQLILTPAKVPIPPKQARNIVCGQYYTIILMGEFLGGKMDQLRSLDSFCDLDIVVCGSNDDMELDEINDPR